MNKIKKRIEKLRKEIQRYNELYYKKGISEISDEEYDGLLKELEELERSASSKDLFGKDFFSDTPTTQVGSDLTEGFPKIQHRSPMLSISNSYDSSDLYDFDKRIKKILGTDKDIDYCVEHKIDGVAVSLVYRSGHIGHIATRGDGKVGDVITGNALTISSIPETLRKAPDLEIRGEIYMDKDDFAELNRHRSEKDLALFANPRNTVAGSIKLLDVSELKQRNLKLICYFIDSEINSNFHTENLKLISKLGFPVSDYFKKCTGIDKVIEECLSWQEKKHELPYEIDGMVVKVNNTDIQKQLGSTSKSPRWVMAYKFNPDRAETVLKKIKFQVGRTGVVTPVAELEPVKLSGTTVKRATLHNEDEIISKDIREGDTVLIEKAGEIIPKVIAPVISKRKNDLRPFEMISRCPVCGQELFRNEDESAYRCINISCPEQIERQIVHFASKGAMDISGLGPSMVKMLLKNKIIENIEDIYKLEAEKIKDLERMGERSAENLIRSIDESRSRGLDKLLFGLGIRHIGKEAALVLARNFGDMDDIIETDTETLEELDDFGSVMASSVKAFFDNEKNLNTVRELRSSGVKMSFEEEVNENSVDLFKNKNVVVTGSFTNMKREDLRELIISGKGKMQSSVTKNTEILLCGKNPGSKLKKAEKLEIRIIHEEELNDILN